jgi:anti-sigma B factor antagonist
VIIYGAMETEPKRVEMEGAVSIQGRIAIDTSDEMRSRIGEALRSKPESLMVDLSDVTYMDTSGLATLIEALRIARQQSTQIVLQGIQEQPRYLLTVTNLDRVFTFAEDTKS